MCIITIRQIPAPASDALADLDRQIDFRIVVTLPRRSFISAFVPSFNSAFVAGQTSGSETFM